MYALNLNNENRILSSCVVLAIGKYDNMPIVDTLPVDDITNYLYVNGEFVYSPLPVEPEEPTWEERVDAQLLYTALMTDTLVQE